LGGARCLKSSLRVAGLGFFGLVVGWLLEHGFYPCLLAYVLLLSIPGFSLLLAILFHLRGCEKARNGALRFAAIYFFFYLGFVWYDCFMPRFDWLRLHHLFALYTSLVMLATLLTRRENGYNKHRHRFKGFRALLPGLVVVMVLVTLGVKHLEPKHHPESCSGITYEWLKRSPYGENRLNNKNLADQALNLLKNIGDIKKVELFDYKDSEGYLISAIAILYEDGTVITIHDTEIGLVFLVDQNDANFISVFGVDEHDFVVVEDGDATIDEDERIGDEDGDGDIDVEDVELWAELLNSDEDPDNDVSEEELEEIKRVVKDAVESHMAGKEKPDLW